MTFDDHVQANKNSDGTYDLAAAEAARYAELAGSDDVLDELARKAARDDRRAWQAANRERLAAVFKGGQGEFSFDVDLDAKVSLGSNVVVSLRDMDRPRIQLRKDLQTKAHLEHNAAYDREMRWWFGAEAVLPPDGTVGDIA